LLTLNYRDSRPIYGQIKDGLRRMIVSGALEPGEKLPSIRAMAVDLAINPNTIQRAYEALEAEGYVYSVPGKGSFAAPNTGVDEGRKHELLQTFDQTAGELLFLGVSGQELWARIRALEGGEAQCLRETTL